MTEIIEIQDSNGSGEWQPFVGDETIELLRSKGFTNADRTPNESGERVLNETYRIMQVCGNPNNPTNNETGIVIGYVQSGKTLSFTTLTALARDNNYQIVIVIAGVSTNLVNQSTNRLSNDLRLSTRFDRQWTLLQNPSSRQDLETIETTLAQWSDPTFPNDKCRTLLITVMKNTSHLNNLVNLLQGKNLQGVPTLIIDDEGDQASLNTRARWAARQGIDVENLTENQVSTIYRRITALRSVFPHHTFLQYTATPQANLFINIMDRLSPNFIRLLTPGQEYTGGIEFFRNNPNLIVEIPANEISTNNNQLFEIPESLKSALRIYFLGVVAGEINKDQRNRTMLVHPSRLQGDHSDFTNWIRNTCNSWQRLLSGNDNEDRRELINEFQVSYNHLQQTVPNLQPFKELAGVNLIHAIRYTQIVEVNSRNGETPQIPWNDSYSWILVGGQSMDRGFTVEGLTVTYMPRNIGTGNVDTIQQRARFFGYKRNYLGFCRVFLDQVTIDSYNFIIAHEEDVRNRLLEFDFNNKHLNDWDREVVLDQMLNLTRRNVIYDDLDRDTFGNDWFRINAPHDTEELIETNRESLFTFLQANSANFLQDTGHVNRTEEQKHLVARIKIKDCLEHLLNKLRYTRESDSATYSSLRGILKGYIAERPDDECLVYLMSTNSIDNWEGRTRRLNRNDEIQQLFQGRNPRTGEVIYPGDSEIKDDYLLTIQVHLLNIRDTDFTKVPTLAIWVPEHIGTDIIRQA
ncbi:Z1 domain-containing protein [Chitinophaga eiseniae]|uniref:Alpha-1,4 polygalactosaminidase n=1 Tax=Chitinophaga eiseniae TaxID=634771 RepID=A0A847SRB6_9BACT|nr:Z1 domain-containing protein [Chitinophaga eiseniae]NLR82904.1 alpha-1,4 polygalactosaminidase [Chitinophaga eiseniae]